MARTDGSCEEDEDKAQHTDIEEVGGITISRDFLGPVGGFIMIRTPSLFCAYKIWLGKL